MPRGLVVTNNHVIEGADQVKVSLADKREFEAEIVLQGFALRPRGAAHQGAERALPGARIRRFRRAAGRRPGARHRQSVRRRPDRDPRHRLGGGAHPGRHHRLPVLHPDRCRHQSRQFRRRAGRPRRQAGRHQHRDLLALGRLAGHRLRHPRQHGAVVVASAKSGGSTVQRPWLGRAAAGGDAGDRRRARPQASGRRAGRQRHPGKPGGARRAQDQRPDHRRSTDRRSTTPMPSTTASPPRRIGGTARLGVLRAGKETAVIGRARSGARYAARRDRHRHALAVPGRQGWQPVAGAGRRPAARSFGPGRRDRRRRQRLAGAEPRLPARRPGALGEQHEDRQDPRPRAPRRRSRAGTGASPSGAAARRCRWSCADDLARRAAADRACSQRPGSIATRRGRSPTSCGRPSSPRSSGRTICSAPTARSRACSTPARSARSIFWGPPGHRQDHGGAAAGATRPTCISSRSRRSFPASPTSRRCSTRRARGARPGRGRCCSSTRSIASTARSRIPSCR